MMEVFAERGGDPDRPGKRDPLDACCGSASATASPAWESPFGRRAARMARRVRGDRPRPTSGRTSTSRAAAPTSIFPHHEMSAGAGAGGSPGERLRPGLRPPGHGRPSTAHKMSKSLGNLVLVSRLRADGVDRRRSGSRCSAPALPQRLGVDRRGLLDDATKRLAVWRDAVRRTDHDLDDDGRRRSGGPGRAGRRPGRATARSTIVDAWAEGPGAVGRRGCGSRPPDGRHDPGLPRHPALIAVELAGVAGSLGRRRLRLTRRCGA